MDVVRQRLITDLVYSQVPAWFGHVVRPLRMSLLLPMSRPAAPSPVILWICGGAWVDMDKDAWMPELLAYAREGYAVASIEYRSSGQALFPAQLVDVKTAIRFLRAQADRFGLDKGRFAAMGESAGGHLAAMAGVTGGIEGFEGTEWRAESSALQAVVDWYGPTDFLTMSSASHADPYARYASPESLLLGFAAGDHPAKARAAGPAAYAGKDSPPFLILHGDKDAVVPLSQSESFYDALAKAGVDASLVVVEGAGHATDEFVQPAISGAVLEFLDSRLGRGKA
jgi:acetyl esterase/lipase